MRLHKYFKIFFSLVLFILLLITCKEKNDFWLSETGTNKIDTFQIILNGTLVNEGSNTQAEYGICFSKNAKPTLNDSVHNCGKAEGLKSYQTTINLLTPGKYFYSSYVKDGSIPQLGVPMSFEVASKVFIYNWVDSISKDNATLNVKISNNLPLIVSSDATWAKPEPLYLGTGLKQSLSLQIESNSSQSDRVAKLTIKGDGYQKELKITQKVVMLSTSAVSDITQNTANSGGVIIANESLTITARGVCWGTTVNPTITGNKTTDGVGIGSYNSNITGLLAGSKYYLRAYISYSVGTIYGQLLSFTTLAATPAILTTTAISNITQTTASSGGNITSEGGTPVSARGVCWSTTSNPTLTNSKTTDGSGTGSFTSNITGIIVGTKYYVRAYATTSAGTSYGTEVNFTTLPPGLPTLSTTEASAINYTSATSGGNVISDGGAAITVRGVYWSTSPAPTTALTSKLTATGTTGTFTSNLTGLADNTKYYLRAFATNSMGTAYGAEVNFTTLPLLLPTLSTTEASAISYTSATSGGNVISDGGAAITARGVCWSTSPAPTTALTTKLVATGTTGTFTSNLTGLTDNTKYYLRSYATNSMGTAYGNEISFTTMQYTLATLSMPIISNIGATKAVVNANITSTGGSKISEAKICYSLTANPTIADNKAGAWINGDAFINGSFYGITKNTTYHVRAYALNDIGVAYSDDVTFTTASLDYVSYNGVNLYYSRLATNVPWGTNGLATPSANSTSDGQSNTSSIISVFGSNGGIVYAAKVCDDLVQDGFSDFYLPSLNELKTILTSGANPTIWTSTSINAEFAYSISEMGGHTGNLTLKTTIGGVYCVRKNP